MDEFTKEEIDRINLLYGTDFKDVTPEDVKLGNNTQQRIMRKCKLNLICLKKKTTNALNNRVHCILKQ